MLSTVKWQIGTYSGSVEVLSEPDEDAESVIARAKRRVMRDFGPHPGMCLERWREVSREDTNGDSDAE
jgi:hypothetical protein